MSKLKLCIFIACTSSPPFLQGGLNLLPNFQKGGGGGEGLGRTLVFRGGCGERGGDLYEEVGCNFILKSKLTSEILSDKKC